MAGEAHLARLTGLADNNSRPWRGLGFEPEMVHFYAATDLAEHLVRQGTPFREAHAIVGRLVRRHLDGDGPLADLAAEAIDAEAATLVAPGVGVTQRSSPGAAGPSAIQPQMEAYRAMLDAERAEFMRRSDDGT